MNVREGLQKGGWVSLAALIVLTTVFLVFGVTEELPVGSMKGTVMLAESGRPMPRAKVILRPAFELADVGSRLRTAQTDEKGNFSFRNLPSGEYIISAYTKAHTLEKASVFVQEAKETKLNLELQPNAPFLEVFANQQVYTSKENPEVLVRGFARDDQIKINLYQVKFESIVSKKNLYTILSPVSTGTLRLEPSNSPDLTPVQTLATEVINRDLEGIFEQRVRLPKFKEGLYWVQFSCGDRQQSVVFNISQIALVSKQAGTDILAYVTDIESGQPITGANLFCTKENTLVPAGQTDAQGIAHLTVAKDAGKNVLLVATHGESKASNSLYLYDEVSQEQDIKLWTYTDRPVYRPGDQVHFKGIVRVLEGSAYRLPVSGNQASPQTVKVQVLDPDLQSIQTMDLPLGAQGTFHGNLKLPTDRVGNFKIVARYNGVEYQQDVRVAAYRKPEFEIKIRPLEPYYIRGQKVRMQVECKYYYGAPVVGATVSSWIRVQASGMEAEEEGFESPFTETNLFQSYAGEVEAVTDENGIAILEWDSSKREIPELSKSDGEVVFEVTLRDPANKVTTAQGKVRLMQGEISLRSDVDAYIVSPGQTVKIQYQARFNKDQSPARYVPFTVETGYERWDGKKSEFIRERVVAVRTNAEGIATLELGPSREGVFVIKASLEYPSRNMVSNEAQVYVWRQGQEATLGPTPKISIVLDKKQYQIGEQATAFIRCDQPGGQALVTVEAKKIYWSKVVPLTQEVTVFQLPVTQEIAPNAYVSVAYVKGKRFLQTDRKLLVDMKRKRLDVSVTPHTSTLEPGGEVSYTITTRDQNGKPVSADLSLGVVDEAVYAVEADRADPMKAFYPMRYQEVITNYSFPTLYLDGGEKDLITFDVRKKFEDTAYWNPSIRTDQFGKAVVKVKLPDNLTRWRATVIAVAEDTSVGKAAAQVRVRKDLMVTLSAPSFIVRGDRISIFAVVTNDTPRPHAVDVQLFNVRGLDIEGTLKRHLELKIGATQAVEWKVTPNIREVMRHRESSGLFASLAVSARSKRGLQDATELRVPIKVHEREVNTFDAGEFSRSLRTILYRFPEALEGSLRIFISPSLPSVMESALNYLVSYPYGCAEQTLSRFVPGSVAVSTLSQLGMQKPKLQQKIEEVRRQGWRQLREIQRFDGGWGWFSPDQADPYVTALALESFWRLKRAGIEVEERFVQSSLDWAKEYLGRALVGAKPDLPEVQKYNLLYLSYAKSLYGEDAFQKTWIALGKPNQPEYMAMYLMLLQVQAKDPAYAVYLPQIREVQAKCLEILKQEARTSGVVMYWPEEYGVEKTARIFEALVKTSPQDKDLPKILRYLMANRRGEGWSSTRDTANVIYGLCEYLRAVPLAASEPRISAFINGVRQEVQNNQVSVQISSMKNGSNVLELVAVQPGIVYYSLQLKQTPYQPLIGTLVNASGMTLQRTFHSLSVRRVEEGNLRLMPSTCPKTSFRSGEPVRCRLTLQTDKDREFVVLEVPSPANMRVVENEAPPEWSFWWSSMQVFDDRIVFFMRRLPQGKHVVEYNLYAETPGVASALPPIMYEMYAPEKRASSGEDILRVIRR